MLIAPRLWFLHPAVLVLACSVAGQGEAPPADKKQPRDRLDGAPFVNATSWAIADGKTGELLWSREADQVLPMASTTKVMTALVVLDLVRKDETVLAEVVTVSRFAASTGGSSAKIRQGDQLPVGALLYGLLLPSGNDAANALAEHFGGRFKPPSHSQPVPWTPRSAGRAPAYVNFVAEMNRRAKQLKMSKTRYVNPHGLDSQYHRSSARDILRLSKVAMGHPEFRKRVLTRRHTVKVIDGEGSRRLVEWANTNRLLAIEGYIGLKTGTTPMAGCCLVSCAVRGEDELLLVVLNSTTRNGRYVDTRNLFRWAFQQRVAGGK